MAETKNMIAVDLSELKDFISENLSISGTAGGRYADYGFDHAFGTHHDWQLNTEDLSIRNVELLDPIKMGFDLSDKDVKYFNDTLSKKPISISTTIEVDVEPRVRRSRDWDDYDDVVTLEVEVEFDITGVTIEKNSQGAWWLNAVNWCYYGDSKTQKGVASV